jgi:prepilin-type N-terminal cleavage/methylation domain-containing protein
MLASRPRGFSLAEILVVLAILAILGAIMLPVVASRIDPANAATLGQNLQQINVAIQRYKENVRHYPKQLVQLTTKPSGSVLDACGLVVTSTDVALWRGPYLSLIANSNGIQSGDVSIDNTIVRSPANTSGSTPSLMNGVLELSVSNVPGDVANDLEAALDEGSDPFDGTITYVGGTLTYSIPIRGC